MSQSLSQIYLHLVFSTKRRENTIRKEYRSDLFAYLAGTLNSMQCPAIIVGDTENHVHILFRMNKVEKVSDIIRRLKSHSTIWLKDKFHCDFGWQDGYGIFSVSQSKVETVRRYIENQEQHHRKVTFEEEFLEFLKAHEIQYDERHLWA